MRARGARFWGAVVGGAGLVLVVTAIVFAIAGTGRATARESAKAATFSEPRPTTTPETPGIVIASSPKLDMPDPFLMSARGKDYLYFSTAFADVTDSNIPVMSGRPGHWGPVTDALPKLPSWGVPSKDNGTTWGPFVTYLQGRYVMYFAALLRNHTPLSHCIGIATSSRPEGPFTPVGKSPLICQTSLGGDIDAVVFTDLHGPRGKAHPYYMVWKSDNNNILGWSPTTIWAAPLSNNGLSLAGKAVTIFNADRDWMAPLLESPQMTMAPNGSVWLFFSGGSGYYLARYAIGAAECNGPLGGCHSVTANPLIYSNLQGAGPGEETIYVGPDHSTWVLYNPWHSGEVFDLLRPTEAARIGWGPQGPYVAQAGEFPAP